MVSKSGRDSKGNSAWLERCCSNRITTLKFLVGMGRKPSATTMLRDRAAIRALSLLVAVFTGAEAFRVPGAVLSARMQGFLAGGRLTRPEASRTLRRAPASSLKMQWKEEQPLPYQAQWEAFQNYNTGRWKGRFALSLWRANAHFARLTVGVSRPKHLSNATELNCQVSSHFTGNWRLHRTLHRGLHVGRGSA
jgi:hypothetical protein